MSDLVGGCCSGCDLQLGRDEQSQPLGVPSGDGDEGRPAL